MTLHPDHTFSPTDATLLTEHGYCIGYDIDGNPERAMAVHPETGIIIRKFWGGCSIWHPSEKRTKEKTGSKMATILDHTAVLQRSDKYSKWHTRSSNFEALATLRTLALKRTSKFNAAIRDIWEPDHRAGLASVAAAIANGELK